jgi:redox-sensing transcriptional repressor
MNRWVVRDVALLEAFCREHKPLVAILCTPRSAAEALANNLIAWGVKGFWNFSHYDLALNDKDGVVAENVHLSDSLMTLSFRVNERLEQ